MVHSVPVYTIQNNVNGVVINVSVPRLPIRIRTIWRRIFFLRLVNRGGNIKVTIYVPSIQFCPLCVFMDVCRGKFGLRRIGPPLPYLGTATSSYFFGLIIVTNCDGPLLGEELRLMIIINVNVGASRPRLSSF